MPCFKPLRGYWSRDRNPETGKRRVVFNSRDGYLDMPVKVPCQQCVGCRLARSREWAIRCIHEASLWQDNCFITLTYKDEFLPQMSDPAEYPHHVGDVRFSTLLHDDFQKFMKRLRKQFGAGIRFYMCGEYGSQFGRPHYHAILFNMDFSDRKLWQVKRDVPLFVSPSLSELWPFGFSTVGNVTFESAAYVARYVMKKMTGDLAADYYDVIDPDTGELFRRKAEYNQPSRRGGIGLGWFEKYGREVWPDDFVIINGKRLKPPRYYEKILEITDPDLFKSVKSKRNSMAVAQAWNQTPERLIVREKVQVAKLNRLKRELD